VENKVDKEEEERAKDAHCFDAEVHEIVPGLRMG